MVTVLYALVHAAADEVASGRLDGQSAPHLVHTSALAALQPEHSAQTANG